MTSPLCEGPPSAKGDPLNPSCLVADSSENTQPAAVLQEPVRNPAAVRSSRQALLRDAIQEKAALLELTSLSMAEAAWRGSDAAWDFHISEARLVLLALIEDRKEFRGLSGEVAS